MLQLTTKLKYAAGFVPIVFVCLCLGTVILNRNPSGPLSTELVSSADICTVEGNLVRHIVMLRNTGGEGSEYRRCTSSMRLSVVELGKKSTIAGRAIATTSTNAGKPIGHRNGEIDNYSLHCGRAVQDNRFHASRQSLAAFVVIVER